MARQLPPSKSQRVPRSSLSSAPKSSLGVATSPVHRSLIREEAVRSDPDLKWRMPVGDAIRGTHTTHRNKPFDPEDEANPYPTTGRYGADPTPSWERTAGSLTRQTGERTELPVPKFLR